MKAGFFILLLFLTQYSWSQLTDDFSDGDFSASPVWSGTAADFIVNTDNQVQTNGTVAATSYLSTPHELSTLDGMEWRYWIKQAFSPSSSNFGRVYLTASSSDLSTDPDGFFLQLGESGSLDAVRLNKSVSGVVTEICAGTSAEIANSFVIGIRVVRDNTGIWSLFIDATGGENYSLQSTGTEATNLLGTHTGVLDVYTVSNATKFYFDNVYVGTEIFDTQAPTIISATAISTTLVDVLFNEQVAGSLLTTNSNYNFTPSLSVQSVTVDGANQALLHITLNSSLSNGQSYVFQVNTIEDVSGNVATNLTANFQYLVAETPVKGDVIISEFMCDPTPTAGLPELEFVEIYNRSSKIFNLEDWKLGDASSDGTIVSGWILPGEYKILCSSSSLVDFPTAFAVTSFPSLNNAGDDIVLKDTGLVVIDKVAYTDDWYKNEIKKDGGYTLELINPNDPCSDINNWIASNAFGGGTPDLQNSVYDLTADTQVPSITNVVAISPNFLEVTFSEGMDSTSLVNGILTTTPNLPVSLIPVSTSYPNTITVEFAAPFVISQLYTFTYANVADCWLNATTVSGQFALADIPVEKDLIINEILFDPGTGGTDFVELYNRSQKVLNLNGFSLANYDDDTISNIKSITTNYILFPREYIVITADSAFQKTQFTDAAVGTYYQMSLPSLNNDSSTIYLQFYGQPIDKVSYTDDWHLSLIDETENKTLERIDPEGISNDKNNWHTAAEPIGFGTPGKRNSQYQVGGVNGDFGTLQPIFSPDNDGLEDVIQFFYTMQQPGMIANAKIFDDQGRLIRDLLKNELLGIQGNYSWDGVNDNNTKAGLGVYLCVIEAFSVDGNTQFSKRVAFTLAGKLD